MNASFLPRLLFSAAVAALSLCAVPQVWAQSEEAPEENGEAVENLESANPRTRMYEAMVDVQDENFEEAIPKLEWVIEQDPTLLGAWETLGWAYWLTGNREDAVVLWNRLKDIAPNEPMGYNLLAQVATRDGEFGRAEELYRQSLELNPGQFEVRVNMARVLMWGGKREPAIKRFERLLKEDPERMDIQIDLAWGLYANEQYEESLEHWNDVIEVIPGHAGFLLARANVHLLMGMLEEAEADARAALEVDPENLAAMNLLIAQAMRKREPLETVRRLNELMDVTSGQENKVRVAQQLAVYIDSVHKESPDIFSQEDVIAAGKDAWDMERESAESALFYGEALVGGKQFEKAEEVFEYVLEELNPNNERARYGLLETYLGRMMIDKAEEQLMDNLRNFNAENPFRHVYWARIHNARGEFEEALKALDRLEREGARGAVFCLLYHGISPSEFSDMPSVRQLREQTMALRRDGFRFITPDDLPSYFENKPEPPPISEDKRPLMNRMVEGVKYSFTGDKPEEPATLGDYSPDKVVLVTFDDALRTSFRYGTMVAEELDTKFTMFVGVGDVMSKEQRYVAQFPEIREYHDTGRWQIESHLWDAGQLFPVNEEGTKRRLPIANRLWLEDKDRLETLREYQKRVRHEFADSKQVLARELGVPEEDIDSVAYPYGEIGQENLTNIELFDVVDVLMNEAEIYYERGFIQNRFGYAVKGDNPLLYKRYEPYRHASGRHVLRQAYLQHPVFVARRMRAEMATLNGKYDMAMRNVELLRRDGYPEEDLRDLTEYVDRHLARLVRLPDAVEDTAGDAERMEKRPLIELRSPLIGVDGRTVRANDVIDEQEIGVFAGINLNRRISLQVRASRGEIDQTFNTSTNRVVEVFQSTEANSTRRFPVVLDGKVVTAETNTTLTETVSFQSNRVDEIEYDAEFAREQVSLSYIHDSGAFTIARAGYYRLDLGEGREEEETETYGIEHQWRPFPNMDFIALYNHDAVPSARDLITYDQLAFRPIWRVNDGWHASGVGSFSFYDDNNSYLRVEMENLWNVSRHLGVWFGLHNSVDTTDEASDLYWTPYWEQRHYLILEIRRNYPNLSASLRGHLGMQKSEARDEDVQEFLNLRAQAEEQGGFSAGEGPDEDWNPLIGVQANISRTWDWGLEVNGSFTVNSTRAYTEHSVYGSVLYRF